MARHVSVTVGSVDVSPSVGGAITHGQQVDATNTGVAGAGISEASLVSTGATTYSTNGETVTGRYFTDTVTISADNVTLSGCVVEIPAGTDSKAIVVTGTGATIVDCTVRRPTGNIYMCVDAQGTSGTIQRCDLSGAENIVTLGGDGWTITESYLHGSTGGATAHKDTVEVYGGSGHTIQLSRLVHPRDETSCINIAPWFGSDSVIGVDIKDNFLDGGNRTVLVDLQSTGVIQNVKVRRNVFGGHTAISDYDPFQDNDGRGTVQTDAAQVSNPDAVLWPTTGADLNTWGECSDLTPDRTGETVIP